VTFPQRWPFYCEENVWRLACDPRFHGRRAWAILVTNARKTVAMWSQRATGDPTVPVIWDYHVVLGVAGAQPHGEAEIWDVDCTRGVPLPLRGWIEATFHPRSTATMAPRFRVIDAQVYRTQLRTDRRHMKDAERGWKQPPPPWPVVSPGESNLRAWLDLQIPEPGQVVALDELAGALRV